MADKDISLERSIVELLKGNNLKLMTVESCTGGMVASRIVNVPGASEVFGCGLVTYSNEAKMKLAGVNRDTLDTYTAVSRETAREMVRGTDLSPKADVIAGVTGYATQGGPDEPAGLVYISCNVLGEITVKENHFTGDRQKVREAAATETLNLIKECILKHLNKQKVTE